MEEGLCRSSWSKLTPSLICHMFLCALIGMERVDMRSKSGKAKVLGAIVCVAGVSVLSFYKGTVVMNPSHGAVDVHRVRPKGLGLGAAFLVAGSLGWSSWFLLQTKIGKSFPHQYSTTSIMCLFSSIQSAVLCLIIDRNFSKWILQGEIQIISVFFGGIVGSGLCYVVMSWCVKRRGPIFTAAFSPLIQFFAAVFDVILLHEPIYLGSILGSVMVIVGMYVLLWGKSKDQEACEDLPKRIDGQDSTQFGINN